MQRWLTRFWVSLACTFECFIFQVCLSFLGILVVLCRKQSNVILLTDFFIALAVSTMVGDAFFHILPHMLGLHSHDHGDEDDHADHDHYEEPHEDHDHEEEEVDFMLITAKIGVLVGSMYAMWLIGALMRLNGVGSHGHSHGHITELTTKEEEEEAPVEEENTLTPVESKENGEVKWSTIWGILIGDCFHNFVGTCGGEFLLSGK